MIEVERKGKKIQFYPVRYLGMDFLVVLENGKKVDNPFEYLMDIFKPVKAAVEWAKKEGD